MYNGIGSIVSFIIILFVSRWPQARESLLGTQCISVVSSQLSLAQSIIIISP
jgi:hypothetical protein